MTKKVICTTAKQHNQGDLDFISSFGRNFDPRLSCVVVSSPITICLTHFGNSNKVFLGIIYRFYSIQVFTFALSAPSHFLYMSKASILSAWYFCLSPSTTSHDALSPLLFHVILNGGFRLVTSCMARDLLVFASTQLEKDNNVPEVYLMSRIHKAHFFHVVFYLVQVRLVFNVSNTQ